MIQRTEEKRVEEFSGSIMGKQADNHVTIYIYQHSGYLGTLNAHICQKMTKAYS